MPFSASSAGQHRSPDRERPSEVAEYAEKALLRHPLRHRDRLAHAQFLPDRLELYPVGFRERTNGREVTTLRPGKARFESLESDDLKRQIGDRLRLFLGSELPAIQHALEELPVITVGHGEGM